MYRLAKRRFGEVPEPFTVAAHHPRLLIANAVHETLLQSGVEEAARQRPRAGGVLDGPHRRMLVVRRLRLDADRLDGLDVERLKDIDNYATSPAYTDDERAAIAYADAMTTDPHTVTDEQVADLRRRFGDDGVIELTYQIGVENMRARMYSALGITEQGFNSGDACRVPWATEDCASGEPVNLSGFATSHIAQTFPSRTVIAVTRGVHRRESRSLPGEPVGVAAQLAVDQRQLIRRQPPRPVTTGQPEEEPRHLVRPVDDAGGGRRPAVGVAGEGDVRMQKAHNGFHVACRPVPPSVHRPPRCGCRRRPTEDADATARRAREASWRAAASLTPSTSAISPKGTAKPSCSTNATR